MKAKFALLTLAAIGAVAITAGILMPNSNAGGATQQPAGPIMYMSPRELFSEPKLRELAVAAQVGNVKKIDTLIAAGVNVNGKGKYGITPLFSAVQVQNKKGFEALLEHGANPNVIGTDGYTLMNQIACCSADPYFMKQALRHGGNPNLVAPYSGKTPLIAAITVTGKVNIPALIKAGADLNYQMPAGKFHHSFLTGGSTAMMAALSDLQFDVIYELLKVGADYRLKDAQGRDIADHIKFSFRANISPEQERYREEVIEFLKQHNAWIGGSGSKDEADGGTSSGATTSSQVQARESSTAPLIRNYEAPGNLESTHTLGCASPDEISSEDTPADLYPAVGKCLEEGHYDLAAFLYALAGVYSYYDTLRVADETAHDAAGVFQRRLIEQVPEAKRKRFISEVTVAINDPKKLAELCNQIKKIGPPAYYPRYMVQHGMQAFTGEKTPNGLVPDFDVEKAWTKALSSFLHCPEA